MDLHTIKGQLLGLSYTEKIELSEWLHTQIDLERGAAVKEKAKQVGEQLDKFLTKATEKTKDVGNSLLDQFRQSNNQNPQNNQNNFPEKR
jgi:hypothetical protein